MSEDPGGSGPAPPGGPADLVVIGRLGRPHGVAGALRATPTGPTLATLRPGEEVVARPPLPRSGAPGAVPRGRRLRVASLGEGPGALLIRFDGVATREDAAALTLADLVVPASRLPAPADPDELYVRDLIGFRVLAGDDPLGPVTGVHPAPANDALEVAAPGGPLLLPFTADAVVELDREARTIRIRPDLLPAWAWAREPGA
ncbi:MAG: ribosome maturation factor RimM [Thermoleophilia bacterium]|jgi:16S rRNA processing protein RimM|nr:ribosome maturation factor RimM [Thermoleophilia bacterium]